MTRPLLAGLMTCALLLSPLAAQEEPAPELPPPQDEMVDELLARARALQSEDDQVAGPPLELALPEAIGLAIVNNLGIHDARLSAQSALESFGAAWGPFDPVLFADTTGSYSTTAPTPSNFVGGIDVGASGATDQTFYDLRAGLRGTLLTGTFWQFVFGPRRFKTQGQSFDFIDTDADGIDDTLVEIPFESDVYTADWEFSLTHPLLRNGADDYAISGVELAAADATIAQLAADELSNDTLAAVVAAYWNLVFARQSLATRLISVELAAELVDITRRKFEQGLQNRIDVTQVQAELAQRREEEITARNLVGQTMDELRRIVFAPLEALDWSRPIVPITEAVPVTAGIDLDVEALVGQAMSRRPDVRRLRLAAERADIEVRRAENQVLPRLDITGAYGMNSNSLGYWQSLDDLDQGEFDSASITLSFDVPIGNRGAGYALRRAQVERDRAGVQLRDGELLAVTEVREAARNVELQSQRVATTTEAARLNREVYEGEKLRLQNDLSTPFQVRETLRNWLEAVDVALRARLDLEVAQVDLAAAQGLLIERFGAALPEPELDLDQRPPAP